MKHYSESASFVTKFELYLPSSVTATESYPLGREMEECLVVAVVCLFVCLFFMLLLSCLIYHGSSLKVLEYFGVTVASPEFARCLH